MQNREESLKCLHLNPEGSGELHCLSVVCKYDGNRKRRGQAFFSKALSTYPDLSLDSGRAGETEKHVVVGVF